MKTIVYIIFFLFFASITYANTILSTNYNITSIDIKDYNHLILSTKQEPTLNIYTISSNTFDRYDIQYNGSILSTETQYNTYFLHTYARSDSGTEYYFSPTFNKYYKSSSFNNMWIDNTDIIQKTYASLTKGYGGINKGESSIYYIYQWAFLSNGGIEFYLNYEPIYTFTIYTNTPLPYTFILKNYGNEAKPLFKGKEWIEQYVDETNYTDTNINASTYAKGVFNGNMSKIFLINTTHNVDIYIKNNTNDYYKDAIHFSCAQLMNFIEVYDIACKDDTDCLWVGKDKNTNNSAIIGYKRDNDIVCNLINTTGNGLNSVAYNQNSYFEEYFYGGNEIFGTTGNIQTTISSNFTIIRPDGYEYNTFSPNQCLYDERTHSSYLCINTLYDSPTKTFYCPSNNSIINCTYGCVNIVYDQTTGEKGFYYLDKTCQNTPISFSCTTLDYITILLFPPLTILCNPFSNTATLNSSYCSNTNIQTLIENNPSESFYTSGTCISSRLNYTCDIGEKQCYGKYNIQECAVNERGYNFWNFTETCVLGKECLDGICINIPIPNPPNPEIPDSTKNFISAGVIILSILLIIIFGTLSGIDSKISGILSITISVILIFAFIWMGMLYWWVALIIGILSAGFCAMFIKNSISEV